MSAEELLEKVRSIIVERLDVDAAKVTMEASFQDDLGASSLDLADLAMELEDMFKVEIPEESEKEFRKVGDVVRFLESNL